MNPSGKGGFSKGKTGNANGRPKTDKPIQELARQKSIEAFKAITDLLNHKDPKIRLAAAREVLDRAYGKPCQSVDLTSDGQPLAVNVNISTKAIEPVKS